MSSHYWASDLFFLAQGQWWKNLWVVVPIATMSSIICLFICFLSSFGFFIEWNVCIWIYDSHKPNEKRGTTAGVRCGHSENFFILKFIWKSWSDQGSHPDRQGVAEGPQSFTFTSQGEMTNTRVNTDPIYHICAPILKYTYIYVHTRFITMGTTKRENNITSETLVLHSWS